MFGDMPVKMNTAEGLSPEIRWSEYFFVVPKMQKRFANYSYAAISFLARFKPNIPQYLAPFWFEAIYGIFFELMRHLIVFWNKVIHFSLHPYIEDFLESM